MANASRGRSTDWERLCHDVCTPQCQPHAYVGHPRLLAYALAEAVLHELGQLPAYIPHTGLADALMRALVAEEERDGAGRTAG